MVLFITTKTPIIDNTDKKDKQICLFEKKSVYGVAYQMKGYSRLAGKQPAQNYAQGWIMRRANSAQGSYPYIERNIAVFGLHIYWQENRLSLNKM